MTADDDVLCGLSHLGVPIGAMIGVQGGFANRMYRLDTGQGSFAVKELNLVDRRRTYHVQDVFRFERAAFAAGIPMPEPIWAGHHTLVHRWVEGEKVPEAPVPAAYAVEIGEILARIHALDVEWAQVSIEDLAARDWPELAERAAVTGQSWADELAMMGGWLEFTRWNILRCLAGVEARTGPDLALSHQSVHNGVRGLPDLFGRLPELETLLL